MDYLHLAVPVLLSPGTQATRCCRLFKAVINCFKRKVYLAEVGPEVVGLEECLKCGECGNSVTGPGRF